MVAINPIKKYAKILTIRLYEGEDEDIMNLIERAKHYSRYKSDSKIIKQILREKQNN